MEGVPLKPPCDPQHPSPTRPWDATNTLTRGGRELQLTVNLTGAQGKGIGLSRCDPRCDPQQKRKRGSSFTFRSHPVTHHRRDLLNQCVLPGEEYLFTLPLAKPTYPVPSTSRCCLLSPFAVFLTCDCCLSFCAFAKRRGMSDVWGRRSFPQQKRSFLHLMPLAPHVQW